MNQAPVILAIDPGPEESAFVFLDTETARPFSHWKWPNHQLLDLIRNRQWPCADPTVVIEKVEGFGMPVGAEVFETVYWSGMFAEAAHPLPVVRVGRKAVKLYLCGSVRAKDPNIRQALLDRYGGSVAKGTKSHPGPLYGVAGDVWSALAVAVTYADRSVA